MPLLQIEVADSVKSLRQQFPITATVRDENANAYLRLHFTEVEDWLMANIPLHMGKRGRARWSLSYSRVHFVHAADAVMFRLAWQGVEIAKP